MTYNTPITSAEYEMRFAAVLVGAEARRILDEGLPAELFGQRFPDRWLAGHQ